MKICNKCFKEFPDDFFPPKRNVCLDCYHLYKQELYRKKKESKESISCIDHYKRFIDWKFRTGRIIHHLGVPD